MSLPTTAERSITIDAPVRTLYDMVADLPRMGEWSPECQRVEWASAETGTGARFRGHNRLGPFPWTTEGRVEVAKPGREFTFVTLHKGRVSTRWSYRFDGDAPTTVTESFDAVHVPLLFALLERTVLRNRQAQLAAGIEATLRALKTCAEQVRERG